MALVKRKGWAAKEWAFLSCNTLPSLCVSLQEGQGLLWGSGGAAIIRVRIPAGAGQWRSPSVSVLPAGLPYHRWGLGHSILQSQVNSKDCHAGTENLWHELDISRSPKRSGADLCVNLSSPCMEQQTGGVFTAMVWIPTVFCKMSIKEKYIKFTFK